MQPEQQQRIMGYFIEEAKDHLNTIEQGLLNLQSTLEDPEMVNEMFRAAHSVKGGAAMLGLNSIQRVAHRLEDFFKILKDSQIRVDQRLESLFLRVFDALQELLGQLQRPFGLTSDAANATVSEVEPTFDELEQHLSMLAQTKPASSAAPAARDVVGSRPASALPTQLDSALQLIFRNDVPVRLRQMLQLFKQSEASPLVRQQLNELCHGLISIGDQFDLFTWCALVETANQAIANPDNDFRTLAPIVIRDIKQAQELILADRASEVAACEQLQALLPTSSLEEASLEPAFDLLVVDTDNELVLEQPDAIALSSNLAFEDLSPADTATDEQDLEDAFRDALADEGLINQSGPEVGIAELNSLADLFEGEVPDLGSTWQEEEVLAESSDPFSLDFSQAPEANEDFSDLLFTQSESPQASPRSTPEADLSDLFGEAMAEEESSTAEASTQDDLDDLLGIESVEPSAVNAPDSELLAAFDSDEFFTPTTPSTSEATPRRISDEGSLDNLGEWFAGMDEQDLALTDPQPSDPDSSTMDLGELEDFALFPEAEPERSTTDADLEALIADPWDEFDAAAAAEPSFAPSTDATQPDSRDEELSPNSLTDAGFADVVSHTHVDTEPGSGELIAEPLEELSDQDDLDFSSLFATTPTTDQSASVEASDFEELTDDLLDFSAENWLIDEAETTSLSPEPDELLLVDELTEPVPAPEPDTPIATEIGDPWDDLEREQPTNSLEVLNQSDLAWADPFTGFDLAPATSEALEFIEEPASEELPVSPPSTGPSENWIEEFLTSSSEAAESTISPSPEDAIDELSFDLDDLDLSEVPSASPESELNFDLGELELTSLETPTISEAEHPDDLGFNLDGWELESTGATDLELNGELDLLSSEPTDDSFSTLLDTPDLFSSSESASTPDGPITHLEADSSEETSLSSELGDLFEEDRREVSAPIDDLFLAVPESSLSLSDLDTEPLTDGSVDLFGDSSSTASLEEDAADLRGLFDDDLLSTDPLAQEETLEIEPLSELALESEPSDTLDFGNELFDLSLPEPTQADPGLELEDDLFMLEVGELPDSPDADAALTGLDSELFELSQVDSSVAEPLSIEESLDLSGEFLDFEDRSPADSTEIPDNNEHLYDLDAELLAFGVADDQPTEEAFSLEGLSEASEFDLGDLEVGGLPADEHREASVEDLDLFADESPLEVAASLDDEPLASLLDDRSDTLDDALVASADTDFDSLENLLIEEPQQQDTFADLDALLEETEVAEPELDGAISGASPHFMAEPSATIEEFADLEALLEDAALEPVLDMTEEAVLPALPQDLEFDELDDLLKEAEEKMGGSPSVKVTRGMAPSTRRTTRPGKIFGEQTMRVPVKHLDNLSNLVGELVVNRNSLEQGQERLRQSLDNLLYQVQQLGDVGQRMQDLYERSLLESSLLASRQGYRLPPNLTSAPRESGTSTQTASSMEVEYDPLEMDRFTGFHSLSQEMIELIVRVRESASDIEFIVEGTDQVTRMFRQVTTQLQEGLTRSRMVPFAQTADRMPRAVRDISMQVGKQAELVVEGRETLIDKMILEQLYDPMTHLVNNALTHGIEAPEVRRSAGKSPIGRITIRAFHQGNQTIISVSDDGAGIDVERVKAKAIEKGLLSPAEARGMGRLDVYDLLFHPGFSTADVVDDFRGRGVGMDVVRTSLSEIRGVINTDSNPGKGTTFTIRLPLTLSISKALCCISDRARIAFPMDGVEDMLDVPRDRIQTNTEGQPCISWRDSLLPLRPLTELLAYNRHLSRGNVYGGNQEDDIISIVVLRSAGNFLALQVDQVLGEQEIVIKQLEGPVPKPVGVAGATVLGDGRIMPIADVLELIDLSMGRIRRDASGSLWEQGSSPLAPEPTTTKTEPTVLIVDDSITVRELLSMTFNKVGYRVEQARDGQEAWEKLRAGLPCDIVFCDIEMPRMDGLELLSRIQKDPHLNHLPIAMLTSRGADRHRQMAASLGASGYFTKPYLEEALLDAAQRMLKGDRLL